MSTTPKQSNDDLRSLAADVARLSKLLTRERERLPVVYLREPRLLRAYLAYFLPSNISKIHSPLEELSLHPGNLLQRETLRVLDIGSGPGSALLGVMDFISRQKQKPRLELFALDQVAENLDEGNKLFKARRERLALNVSFQTIRSGIESMDRVVRGPFDVIILSNVLNELFHHDEDRTAKRTGILKRIMDRFLDNDGSCIIIEPALRETSRDLLEVRDGMLEQGFHLYSPCLFSGKCPALSNPRDWCHEDIAWDPPELVLKIDALTGLRKDSLKFSYLVFRKESFSLAELSGPPAFRVVSDPLISKGKREYYLCGAPGRRLCARLDKDSTRENELFERLKRGNLVRFDKLLDEEKRFKVVKETLVTKLKG